MVCQFSVCVIKCSARLHCILHLVGDAIGYWLAFGFGMMEFEYSELGATDVHWFYVCLLMVTLVMGVMVIVRMK